MSVFPCAAAFYKESHRQDGFVDASHVFHIPANTAEKMGELLSQKMLVYLRIDDFPAPPPALSANIIRDVALLDVDLACCSHLVQKLHGEAGKKSRGGKE